MAEVRKFFKRLTRRKNPENSGEDSTTEGEAQSFQVKTPPSDPNHIVKAQSQALPSIDAVLSSHEVNVTQIDWGSKEFTTEPHESQCAYNLYGYTGDREPDAFFHFIQSTSAPYGDAVKTNPIAPFQATETVTVTVDPSELEGTESGFTDLIIKSGHDNRVKSSVFVLHTRLLTLFPDIHGNYTREF